MDANNIFDADPNKPSAGMPREPYPWLLIDGGGLVVTAWSTHRDLERPEDRVRAAVYVFTTCLASLSRMISGTAKVVVAWDGSDNRKWRRGRHPWYKHGRGSVINRQEVAAVVAALHDLLSCIGVAEVKIDGREADDMVATLARRIDESGEHVLIFSDDKDYIQLVDENVHLCRRSMQGVVMTPEQCELLGIPYGLDYLHIKALMGDPGDNIKGLYGIGEKKAAELIDAIPDFMTTADMDPELIDWNVLSDKLKRALLKAGRRLVWPPIPDDLEFAKAFAKRKNLNVPVDSIDVDDTACFRAAAAEALRCLDLVELDIFAPVPEPEFPEVNIERIPTVLRKLDLQSETDLLSSIYSIARMRNPKAVPPRAPETRAGAAIDQNPNPNDMF